jgi:hypothetical protein
VFLSAGETCGCRLDLNGYVGAFILNEWRCHASVFVGGSLDSCYFRDCHASVSVCGSLLIVVIFGFELLCVSWIDLGRRRLFLREDHASRGQAKIHRLPQNKIALSDVIKMVINKSLWMLEIGIRFGTEVGFLV